MKSKTTKQWGGHRPNAGRKKTEETTLKGFRVNTEALNLCRSAYGKELNRRVNDYIKILAEEIKLKAIQNFIDKNFKNEKNDKTSN